MNKEIVITGLGVVAPTAIGQGNFLKALQQGVSGIDEIRSFDTSDFSVHRGGEIKGLDQIDQDLPAGLGRTARFAFTAVREAVQDAVFAGHYSPSRTGVIFGTTSGESSHIEELDEALYQKPHDSSGLPQELYTSCSSNFITSSLSSFWNFNGPSLMLANACSSGNFAVSLGCEMILQGQVDAIVAGGADSISKGELAGFSRVHAVAPDICQPFDKNRKGMIVSEGAGAVILEERSRAEQRGAKIYASILGCGFGCDAFHLTAPDPEGMAKVIGRALQDAGCGLGDIDYINAHGTGTAANDAAETKAIRTVFGQAADSVPVSSIKSMLGHTMGAASAIETVACCLVLDQGFIPPTINYCQLDPDCDLDYVPNEARFEQVDVLMNNSFAFGGNNASLIIGKG